MKARAEYGDQNSFAGYWRNWVWGLAPSVVHGQRPWLRGQVSLLTISREFASETYPVKSFKKTNFSSIKSVEYTFVTNQSKHRRSTYAQVL